MSIDKRAANATARKWAEKVIEQSDRADKAEARLASTEADILRLKAALEPFGRWSAMLEGEFADYSDDTIVARISGTMVTFGDFRRAARSLSQDGEEGL
ncbi:hypothetical protein [Mesorhizobium sp.]|uniref:hypothetical protein n=1 Tax=Mesorhizobium sp. TaxID=1871066 RepID=UPI000FE4DAE0|nr:hypothetical protein [Mesorhizobium sp.]RWP10467.1 MAG: hypothetical protein EOQ97_12900 [Mesorhizobium sp.]